MGRCFNSIVIDQPAEVVWQTIRNFHELGWASMVVETSEALNELEGDQIGASRVLNGCFHETLLELSDLSRSLKYSIDQAPGTPIDDGAYSYVGSVKVHEVTEDGSSFVEWSSTWFGNDSEVEEFCHPIYVGLLASLKASFS